MGQKIATLEIELLMAMGQSISDLVRFGGVVDKTSAEAIRALDRIDDAMKTMANLDPLAASAMQAEQQLAKAAQAASQTAADIREMRRAQAEADRIEKSGEGMVARLERENALYGLTRAEVKALRIEEAALAVERTNPANADLPRRLREQATLMEANAQATRDAAHAHQMFEAVARERMATHRESEAANLRAEAAAAAKAAAEHDRLAAAVRGSQEAQMADAASAERLRAATDPLYASMARLNAEISESTRLYHAGVTGAAEYARQQAVLTGRMEELNRAHLMSTTTLARGTGTLTQLSFQINDVATMAAMGAPAMQIFASQAGQIFQVAQMAEGGVKGFGKEIGLLTLRFAPLLIGAAAFLVDLNRIQGELERDAPAKQFIAGLGLTAEETAKLKDVTVTSGDIMRGVWKTVADAMDVTDTVKRAQAAINGYLKTTDENVLRSAAQWYGALVGGYRGIVSTWRQFPAVMGDLIVQGANLAIESMNRLVQRAVDLLNGFAERGNGVLRAMGVDARIGLIEAPRIPLLPNANAGAAGAVWNEVKSAIAGATAEAEGFIATTRRTIAVNTIAARDARRRAQADKLIAERTHDTARKAREEEDKHAKMLAGFADRARERTGAYHLEVEKLMKTWEKLVDVMGQPINVQKSLNDDLKAIGTWVNGQVDARADAEERKIRNLAGAFEDLFRRGSGDIWEGFANEGRAVIARLAAEWVKKLSDSNGMGDSQMLKQAGQGAAIGSFTGSLVEMLGVRGSSTGGALGGAVGGALYGPLGAAIGGALGSFAGGLLKTTKKGVATLGAIDGELGILSVTGNSSKRKAAASGAAGSLIDALGQLADQLGGGIGTTGSVSIGIRKDNLRVDPTGQGRTKGAGVIDFGDDQQAAIEFALRDLIADGAIVGLRDATSRLLKNGTDLERQVQKALDFEGVFSSLRQATDPTAYAVDQLDKQFQKLRQTFAEASASIEETADLERLYQIRREAIDREAEQRQGERRKLEAALLEAQGDAAGALAINRQVELAGMDAGLRILQQQVWAAQDAQEAADAARQLGSAWKGVGDSIMDEVRRIRGLTDVTGGGSFAVLMGQFNAANTAARAGDMDAAKNLPQLSKSLLDAAKLAATSRQELDRVQAQTAAMLESTYAAVSAFGDGTVTPSVADLSAAASQGTGKSASANDSLLAEIRALREELTALRQDNNAGHATIAGNTRRIDQKLDDVTAASGGQAISVSGVAA